MPDQPPAPTLTDGVVTLRALQASDAMGCHEQCVDPDSIRWTQVPLEHTLADAHDFIFQRAPRVWADGSEWIFAIEYDGQYAGNLALRDEGFGRAEIAYGARPSARGVQVDGQSVLERAGFLLIEWGFAEKSIETVIWRAEVGNWASRKLAWKLGFSIDGQLRNSLVHRGELVDGWLGTLRKDDPRQPQGVWLDQPVLTADGVRLRPYAERDVPRILQARNDPVTLHWLAFLPAMTDEGDARRLIEWNTEDRATGVALRYALTDEADEFLGNIGLIRIQHQRECELGFWLHPDARGRGLASRGAALAVRHAFSALGVERVHATANAENDASVAVLERLGMRRCGIARRAARTGDGKPSDVVTYDLLADEVDR